MPKEFDPKDRVHVEHVNKKGDWYTVRGRADGKAVEAHIPAQTLESRPKGSDVALIRRTLLGTAMHSQDGGSGVRRD